MTGNLDMGFNKILTHAIPRDSNDVINKIYFHDLIEKKLNTDDLRHIENKLSLKVNKAEDIMSGSLDMGENKIMTSNVPKNDNDIVNVKHLKTLYTTNTSGYVPDLAEDSGSTEFIVSSSSNVSQRLSFHAFTDWKPGWVAITKEGTWIQVKCLEAVRLNKFDLRKRLPGTDRIYNWRLKASDDSITWATLYTTSNTFVGNTTQFFTPQYVPCVNTIK